MQPADDGGAARADRSRQLRRYGPLAAIVVLLVVVAAVVVIGGGDDGDSDGTPSGSGGSPGGGDLDWSEIGDTEPGAPAPIGDMPVTYAEAGESGSAGDHEWPDTCDTERGTVMLPSVYAPPCVPAFDGDNGGATATGVTGDTIKVIYYVPDSGADLESLLIGMGVNDSPEERVETLEDYVEIGSSVLETYGRQVEIVPFTATGAADDVVASRADAVDILAMEPFAVIGGPALDRGTFAQEIADAGVHCFTCGGVLPDQLVLDHAPYLWAAQPTPDQFLGMLDAWVRAGAEADPENVADYAGGDLRGEPRKVGVIHFEQDPPIFGATGDEAEDNFEQVALIESYLLDLPTLPAKATELMARYKSEGITSVVFLGDPIMPDYLTDAATELDYYPEWIFTGTALTDTNVMARQWNPAQMEHAYGMSQLPAPSEQDLQQPITLYRWYFGGDDTLPPARNQYALQAAPAGWLMAGIHMAGPELTAETFARGLFRIPPAGGGPANPQVSYGNWGVFPEMDYQGIDDAVEIWWDPTVEAEDERGEVGEGVWRRSNGGARFTIGDAPAPKRFTDEESAVTVLDELPADDRPPDYPPPEGAPAAP